MFDLGYFYYSYLFQQIFQLRNECCITRFLWDYFVYFGKTCLVYSHYHFQFSEDEEDTKRVVRSAKEKRYEELKNIIKSIKNYKSARDLYSVLSSKFLFVKRKWKDLYVWN